jgi:hypothetical protein
LREQDSGGLIAHPPRAGLSAQWLTDPAYYGKYINAQISANPDYPELDAVADDMARAARDFTNARLKGFLHDALASYPLSFD